MLKDLQEQLNQVTLESATISTEGDTRELLATYLNNVTGFISKSVVQPLARFFSRKDLQSTAKAVEKYNYADLRPVTVRVPVGMKTDYVTYLNALLKASEELTENLAHVTMPFKSWLSKKLGDPASLATLTGNLQIQGYKPVDIEGLDTALMKYISGSHASAPYGTAFARNADWAKVDDLVAKLNACFPEGSDKTLQSDVAEINELVMQLIKRYREDPANYKMSPKTIELLSKQVFEVARHVEYYGALRMRVVEVNEALESTAAKIAGMQNNS